MTNAPVYTARKIRTEILSLAILRHHLSLSLCRRSFQNVPECKDDERWPALKIEKNTDAHNFSHYQHKPRFKSISKISLSLESITCPLYRLMLNFAFCVYEKIFYMNYVAPLLYFANKVNLEKSYKSAKCVCYHQICATKMEHVINPAPLTLCKELTLIVRFSISKAFSIYKLS